MMALGWPWPVLRQGQIWSLMLLYGQKVKQWIFQKLLVYDIRLVDAVNKISTWTFMKIKGQEVKVIHWPLSKITQIQHFKLLFLKKKTTSQLKPNIEPPWDIGMKICSNVLGHITKMVKNIKKTSEPRGRWPWNLVYSIGTQVLPDLFKWWHWVDLDHFYDMVKLVFVMLLHGWKLAYTAYNHVFPRLF